MVTWRRWLVAAGAAVLVVVAVWYATRGAPDQVAVQMPAQLSPLASVGQAAFGVHCARCHGAIAGGTRQGPPLVHSLYVANHHADLAFVVAARTGVRAHHWPYGNMPPVRDVSDADLAAIIAFVRELQRANGIV